MKKSGLISFTLITIFLLCSTAPAANVVGGFFKIYDPSVGEDEAWYINDHCFIQGKDGKWHMFGITHAEPANPLDEDNLAHATADKLIQQPWEKEEFALSVKEEAGETHLWAPHVIEQNGLYYMFYCGGGKKHHEYRINLTISKDLYNWKRHKKNPMVIDGYDARDPFILKHGDKWLMYYTATSKPKGGNYIVACVESDDLVNWSNRKTVFKSPHKGAVGGPTESPTVIKRGDWYYLFIGPRGGYVGTDVFRSKNTFKWELDDKVGHISAHAAEVIQDEEGKWYVSKCGWGKGGLYLSPMYWNDGLDECKPENK